VEPLNAILRELAERDNTVIVVEHDPAVIRGADRVIELGPGSGDAGGQIVKDAPPSAFTTSDTATGRALGALPSAERKVRQATSWLNVKGATANNLRSIDAALPLGVLCAVTGPSGSGKSTLAVDIVYRAVARKLGDFDVEVPGACAAIEGISALKSLTLVDQSPLGRTSRGKRGDLHESLGFGAHAVRQATRIHGARPHRIGFFVQRRRRSLRGLLGEGSRPWRCNFLADVRLVCPCVAVGVSKTRCLPWRAKEKAWRTCST